METHKLTVALPVAECIQRLNNSHNSLFFFSLPGKHHTNIEVAEVDPNIYRFTIMRLGRDDVFWNTFIYMRGYLRPIDEQHTHVEARIYPSTTAFNILIGLVAALVWVWFIVNIAQDNPPSMDTFWLTLVFGVVVGILWGVLRLLQNDLLYTLEKTLRK